MRKSPKKSIEVVFALLNNFSKHLGNRLYVCFAFSFLASILESFGILMIFPLLSNLNSNFLQKNHNIAEIPVLSELLNVFNVDIQLQSSGIYIMLFIVLLFVLKGLFTFLSLSYNASLRAKLSHRLRTRTYLSFISSNYDFLSSKTAGYFSNFVGEQNARAIQGFYHLNLLFVHIFNFIIYFIFASMISYEIAIIGLLFGGLLLFSFRKISNSISQMSVYIVTQQEDLLKNIIQLFQNAKYLISTGKRNTFSNSISQSSIDISKSQKKIWILGSLTHSLKEPIALTGLIAVIFLQMLVFDREIASVFISILFFYRSINSVLLIQNSAQNVLEYSGSITLIDEEITKARLHKFITGPTSISIKNKNITIKNVSFRHKESNFYVLNNLNYIFEANKTSALIGESGSGKSTIINIILGLHKPSSGEILFGDTESCNINYNSILENVGYVAQESNIFNGSLSDNISLFAEKENEKIDQKKLDKVCQLAQLNSFIQGLPEGLNAQVGENGLKLSGGQKQRIALARELYKEPSLLILDEATSALDVNTEALIKSCIEELSGKMTIIVIAHRLSTIKDVDSIALLKNGQIIETGNFKYLSELKNGYFKSMIEAQK